MFLILCQKYDNEFDIFSKNINKTNQKSKAKKKAEDPELLAFKVNVFN